jgi:Fasciclin domain
MYRLSKMECCCQLNIQFSRCIFSGVSIVPDICADLDFSPLHSRRLQYDGALCDPNVLETAKSNKELSTFVELIEVAGLTEYFMCSGPFTLLAPTNDAFEALDSATLDELLLPVNQDKLKDLLLYHIVPGLVLSEDFDDGSLQTLLDSQSISVTIDPIVLNGRAEIVEADVMACNGVVHAINDVLVPGSYFEVKVFVTKSKRLSNKLFQRF